MVWGRSLTPTEPVDYCSQYRFVASPARRFSLPSITRALTGENLTFDMDEQIAELRRDECYVRKAPSKKLVCSVHKSAWLTRSFASIT